MKVLHLDAGLTMRGGQWQALRLLEGLRDLGHDVRLAAPTNGALIVEARARAIDCVPLDWLTLRSLTREVSIVHAHDARSHSLAAALSKRPFVVSRRVAFAIKNSALSKWKYARAAHYLAVSGYVAQMLEAGGVPQKRITLVPDGVPLFDPAVPGSDIIAPATRDPRKGADLAAATGLPIREVSAMPAGFDGAGVFVYLTRSEGLGSAILLAMSAGVPVVASDVGGVPEIVRDGVTGLLTPNDPPTIRQQVERLLADRALAQSLAANARRMIEREFTDRRMLERTVEVYAKVNG